MPSKKKETKKNIIYDWTNPLNYPDPKSTSGTQWAWEFLRRNNEYEKDYETLKKISPLPNDWRENLEYFFCDPPAKPGEKPWDYENRMYKEGRKTEIDLSWVEDGLIPKPHIINWEYLFKCDVTTIPLMQYLPMKYGLGEGAMFDPKIAFAELPGKMDFRKKSGRMRLMDAKCRFNPKHDGEIAIVFDLNFPLSSQLKSAKAILERFKNKLEIKDRRHHVKNFPTYLRVLDGKFSGASNEAIAAELFSNYRNEYPDYIGNKRVEESFEVGTRYRDTDYIYLPFFKL